MQKLQDILFELGTEELPSKHLLVLSIALRSGVETGLNSLGVSFTNIKSYATPRRLAILVEGVDSKLPDRIIERRGPSIAACFNQDGTPSNALLGFMRATGSTLSDLDTLKTDKGAWMSFKSTVQGVELISVLPDIFSVALNGLPIAKRMRWGDNLTEFVRPIHWVILLADDQIINAEIFGVATGRTTRGHRFHSPNSITINTATEYESVMYEKGFVIADFNIRRRKIKALAEREANNVDGHAVIDEQLLNEITSLVEWPCPVLGNIESRFLNLPPEVLITTIQKNQKYFPVKDTKGNLLPYFITFSNLASINPITVRTGNERVVRARLSDAEFFWRNDRNLPLSRRIDNLANVTFHHSLGSILDKTSRVRALSSKIAELLTQPTDTVDRAALLAKTDLLTEMVSEFPELQGIMGRHYALNDGEQEAIALAIEEQYLPKVSGGPLPSSVVGSILSFAEKLDNIVGIFSVGSCPTGDKDPYGLRRAAIGLIRISVESGLDLNIDDLITYSISQFDHKFDIALVQYQVRRFIIERLKVYYLDRGFHHDEFDSISAIRPASLVDFNLRINSIKELRNLPELKSLVNSNKRTRNILHRVNDIQILKLDKIVLTGEYESTLLAAIKQTKLDIFPYIENRNYAEALLRAAQLHQDIDNFFAHVMILSDDPHLRQNRVSLLAHINQLFIGISDISKLQPAK